MKLSVRQLGPSDLQAVEALRRKNSRTLGFLAFEVLEDFLERGWALGAKTGDDDLAGYLLYASSHPRFRITHLCVADECRGNGIARQLFEALRSRATTQLAIRLSCRRDFPAHHLWPKLGFVPVEEVPGRSLAGHPLTRWEYQLADDSQLDLFQEKASSEALDVVIDAQVFFDFHEPSSPKTDPSKALLADFLVDSLDLCVTNEIFVEIDRVEDPKRRGESHQRARAFRTVRHRQTLAEHFETALREFLPSRSRSQVSDIRHLAKAAASDARVFVTRDDAILKRSETVVERIGLSVLSPMELIVQLHELTDAQAYGSSNVSGVDLAWARLVADELDTLLTDFLEPGERRGVLRETLGRFLSRPDLYNAEALRSSGRIRAVRISAQEADRLVVHFARVRRGMDRSLLTRFLIADSIANAVDLGLPVVRFDRDRLACELESHLVENGFTEAGSAFGRICLARSLNRENLIDECRTRLSGAAIGRYEKMSREQLIIACSPVHLLDGQLRYFLVPIKPGYAMSLFDKASAGTDLFGWKSHVLMRWENVYYRSKTRHKAIRPPARILWYESGNRGAITAVSILDAVEIGTPKKLLRKFKDHGTLDWRDLFLICGEDPKKEIMALKFSQTFAFRCPIELDRLREIEGRHHLPLQSPREIDGDLFRRLFDFGYGNVRR